MSGMTENMGQCENLNEEGFLAHGDPPDWSAVAC
jgi:hypothetical protein